MPTDEELLAKLDAVDSSLNGLRSTIDQENIKRDRRIRTNRTLTFCVLGLGVLLVVALALVGLAVARNSDTLDEAEASRRERSLGSCIQFNVKQAADRLAFKASILTLAPEAQGNPDMLTAEQRLVYDAYSREVDASLPFRDCSQAGIDTYLEDPPEDPADTAPTTAVVCDTGDGIVTTDKESAETIGC